MTILIKGIEMPKEGSILVIDSCGEVWSNTWLTRGYVREDKAKAVEVPTPHGRLIDEKWIKEYITDTIKGFEEMNRSDLQNYSLIAGLRTVEVMIEHAPTVIEAEG